MVQSYVGNIYVKRVTFPCKFSGQCFEADSLLVLGTLPGPHALRVSFLWDYVKSKVYETRLANTNDVTASSGVYSKIPMEMLKHVMTSFPLCL